MDGQKNPKHPVDDAYDSQQQRQIQDNEPPPLSNLQPGDVELTQEEIDNLGHSQSKETCKSLLRKNKGLNNLLTKQSVQIAKKDRLIAQSRWEDAKRYKLMSSMQKMIQNQIYSHQEKETDEDQLQDFRNELKQIHISSKYGRQSGFISNLVILSNKIAQLKQIRKKKAQKLAQQVNQLKREIISLKQKASYFQTRYQLFQEKYQQVNSKLVPTTVQLERTKSKLNDLSTTVINHATAHPRKYGDSQEWKKILHQ